VIPGTTPSAAEVLFALDGPADPAPDKALFVLLVARTR
jgi:hypothetical protein